MHGCRTVKRLFYFLALQCNQKDKHNLYFMQKIQVMLVFSLYSVKREKYACEINWITITGWGESARTLCCTGGVCVPSAEGPGWKELQQKAQSCGAVAPHSRMHCASNASRMWLVPNIGEKWGERERGKKKQKYLPIWLFVLAEDWVIQMPKVHSFPPQEVYTSLWNCSGAQRATH